MKRKTKVYFIASGVLLSAVLGFGISVYMTIWHGFGTHATFVPGTCWDANILVVNTVDQNIDELVIRKGGDVLWQGAIAPLEGGCVPKRFISFSNEPLDIQATWFDGTRWSVKQGFDNQHREDIVHILLLEHTGIRPVDYQGAQNTPLGSVADSGSRGR